MGYDREESHCPRAALCDAACAVPKAAISCGIVVRVSDVAGVAVVCHNDVNRDASFDGNWVDLLAEDSIEALREVSDPSCKRVVVDNGMFESDCESVVSIGCSLSRTGSNEAVHGPWLENWVELGATVFRPESVDDAGESKNAEV